MAFTQKFNLITNITAAGVGKYKRDLDGAKRSLSGFKSKTGEAQAEVSRFGKAMTIASGILTARLIRAVAQWGIEAIQMGAQVGTLRGAFEKLTEHVDENVVSLESLQAATRNMIPDIELLKSANIALSLGLPIEGLNDFYESALIVGNAVGITATQAVSDLSRALGRQSPLILDNLGISLKLGESYDIYAARLGKVASALTDQERKTAFATIAIERLNEKATLLSGTMSESQISIQQGTTAIKNFQTAIGEAGASVAPFFLNPLTSALNVLMGRQKTWWQETDSTLDDVSAKYAGVTEGVLEQFDDFQAGLDTLAQNLDGAFGEMGDAAQDWSEALAGYIDDPVSRMAAAEAAFDDFWELQREGFDESISDLIRYYDKYEDITFGGLDETFRLIDRHFTDLEDAERDSHDDRLDAINRFYDDLVDSTTLSYNTQIRDAVRFYDDMLAEASAFLVAIREGRSQDLDDLELGFLLHKQSLENSLEDRVITHEQFEKEMSALEETYRNEREDIRDAYRIQELNAEKAFRVEEERINEERSAAIIDIEQEKMDELQAINEKQIADITAAEEAFLLAMQGLGQQRIDDLFEIYTELQRIADVHGQELGFTFADIALAFGFSTVDMENYIEDLESTVSDSTDEIISDIEDMAEDFETLAVGVGGSLSGMMVDLDSLSTHIAGTIIDINKMLKTAEKFNTLKGSLTLPDLPQRKEPAPEPSLPPPPIIPPPPPTITPPPYVFIDPTVDPFPDLSAQHGFEGLVTRPTTFLVGEAGPEYVSVVPRGTSRREGRTIIIRGPIIQIMGDASERTARLASDLVLKQIRKYV